MRLYCSQSLNYKVTALLLLVCVLHSSAIAAQQNTAPAAPVNATPPATQTATPRPATQPVLSTEVASRLAWKCLTDGLADKDSDHRAQVISALGTMGVRSDVVRMIESALDDKSVTVRQLTAKTLGDMQSRRSIPRLRAALDDESPLVIYAAATALWAMNDKSSEDIFIEIIQGDRKVSRGTIGEGIHYAKEKLHDPSALAQLGAQQAAGAFLGPAGLAVTLVEELAKDRAAPARAASARLLGESTDTYARSVLEDAIDEDKSWLVRASAAEALGIHGPRSSVAKLTPLLEDDHHVVRYMAAAAILRISSRR